MEGDTLKLSFATSLNHSRTDAHTYTRTYLCRETTWIAKAAAAAATAKR